ncbi:DUF72 domain-containing protein [Streptomyces sp. NBC_01445]|uniref:DUF72 domain-containing protein n=1 Tax=Streptomyces sp. NBC_01445 TaxID=2903869 RepID=UPI002DDB61D2|nr:hypothetical protein [Streptomyces sp. NBC_01445]
MAVELRHTSWWGSGTSRRCWSGMAARCAGQIGGPRPVTPLWPTASWGYVRFHGRRRRRAAAALRPSSACTTGGMARPAHPSSRDISHTDFWLSGHRIVDRGLTA